MTDDDGRQPTAMGHLSYSGDLKTERSFHRHNLREETQNEWMDPFLRKSYQRLHQSDFELIPPLKLSILNFIKIFNNVFFIHVTAWYSIMFIQLDMNKWNTWTKLTPRIWNMLCIFASEYLLLILHINNI